MFINSTVNLATREVAQSTPPSGSSDDEKADRSLAPRILERSTPFPIEIAYQMMEGGTLQQIRLGSILSTLGGDSPSVPAANIKRASFMVTQISASVSAPSSDSVAQHMPYGLEAWAINPTSGLPPGFMNNGAFTPTPGGHPISMGEEVMLWVSSIGGPANLVPQWSQFGIDAANSLSLGVQDRTRYWQVASVADMPQFSISIAFSGFFVLPSDARALYTMLQPFDMGKGRLTLQNPDTATVILDRYGAKLVSHALEQDTSTFDGKPAIAATLTFEIPGYDYGQYNY